jgi:hypothetical protein
MIEFRYKTSSAMAPQAMTVAAGPAQDPMSMSVGIWTDAAIINDDYLKASVAFSVPTPGTYYLGFYSFHPVGQGRLHVDDINLLEIGAEIDLKLSMTKSLTDPGPLTYTAGDTIDCFISLTNTGGGSHILYRELSLGEGETDTQLGFDITDPVGQSVPFICKIEKSGPPGAIHFTTVLPDSVIGKVFELWGCYGFELLGDYTIEAHYKNYADPDGIGAWKGELLSDPVIITLE